MRRLLPVLSLSLSCLLIGCSPDPDEEPPADTSTTTQTDADEGSDSSVDTGQMESSDATDTTTSEDTGGDTGDSDTGQTDSPTYHADIAPIMEGRCVTCHTEGGVGPFPLTSYDEVKPLKSLVKSVVEERTMPPYLAADGCRKYKHDTSLTDQQVEQVTEWVDAGAPEGDPDNAGEPLPEVGGGLSRVDETLALPKPYKPTNSPDDYRCFPVKWQGEETKFVTGFGVKPDRDEIVHHVIAYLADPSLAQEIKKKNDAESGPGYTCFGGPGVGSAGSAQSSVGWLGAWAPGTTGQDFPTNTGIKIEPGSTIILQVHYNTLTADPVEDQTEVVLKTDKQVDTQAMFVPFTNPQWISREGAMDIPAGLDDVEHSFSYDVASLLGSDLKIHDAFFHMHELGKAGRLWIDRKDGGSDCLLNIPDWDFNWQRGYRLDQPATLRPGDQLGIECSWDNSKSNQPVIDGQKKTPKDVDWGEGTGDEMCLGVFYVTQ